MARSEREARLTVSSNGKIKIELNLIPQADPSTPHARASIFSFLGSLAVSDKQLRNTATSCSTQSVRSAKDVPASDKRIGLVIPKPAIRKAISLETDRRALAMPKINGPQRPWKPASASPAQKL